MGGTLRYPALTLYPRPHGPLEYCGIWFDNPIRFASPGMLSVQVRDSTPPACSRHDRDRLTTGATRGCSPRKDFAGAAPTILLRPSGLVA